MKTVHGEFFQDRLHHFSTSHCRLCGDMVEYDGGEHESSCYLGSVRWWTEKACTGGREAKQPILVKVGEGEHEVVHASGRAKHPDVMEREPKSKDYKPDSNQEPHPCGEQGRDSNARPSIETLKVKKVVRKASNSREACPHMRSKNYKMPHNMSKSQDEEIIENSCEATSKSLEHWVKIRVNQYESSTIIGVKGNNVKKLELMTGAQIEVKGGKDTAQRTVQISGEKAAVEKAEKVVNGYLMRNCTSRMELGNQEAWALIRPKGKFLHLCRKESEAALYIDFQRNSGKSGELNICGSKEAVEKAKKWIDDFLKNTVEISLSSVEKDILLSGGKNCLLSDIQKFSGAYCGVQGLKITIFGRSEERREAANLVEEQLRLYAK